MRCLGVVGLSTAASPIASLRYLWPISLRYSSTAFVANVFSRKIKCSRSMKRSTSHMAISDRNSYHQRTFSIQFNSECEKMTGNGTHCSETFIQVWKIINNWTVCFFLLLLFYLCLSCALKDVHQSKRHLLLAFNAQQRLQNCTQCSVIVGNILRKLLVQLYREDIHRLVARLDTKWGIDHFGTSNTAAFGQHAGLYHRVPLLNELPARNAGDGDADKAKICAFLLDFRAEYLL